MAEEANVGVMPLFSEVHLAIIPSDRLDVGEADEVGTMPHNTRD